MTNSCCSLPVNEDGFLEESFMEESDHNQTRKDVTQSNDSLEADVTAHSGVEKLATILESGFDRNNAAESFNLFRRLIPLLAKGLPVNPKRISATLGRSLEKTMKVLRQTPSIEWDKDGNIVGAGLTLRPTPHLFQLNGRTLYTWCVLDALMFPSLIGETVRIESPCVSTGIPVQVTVTPEGVGNVKPPSAVVSLVAPEASPDIRRAFCDYVNFFSSAQAASDWLNKHTGAITLPVAEAYQLGQRLAESIFSERTS